MKSFYIVVFLLFCLGTQAQKNKIFLPELSLFLNTEKGIGNNQISEDHGYARGLGVSLNVLSIKKIKLGLGIQYVLFNVKNQSNIGVYSQTRFYDYYFQVSYQQGIHKKLEIEPLIQLGTSSLRQISQDSKDNTNNVKSSYTLNFGSSFNYLFSDKITFFIRPIYTSRHFDFKTNSAYRDYFNNTHTIELNLGLVFLFH